MAGCDLLSGCASNCCNSIVELIDSEILAPFVTIKVGDGNGTITVGNQSCPAGGNHAAIKSMKYGHTAGGDGGGLRFEAEIVDEQGGSFANFINHLITVQDFDKIKSKCWLIATWGWLRAACNSGSEGVMSKTTHVFSLTRIHFTYEGSVIKYKLECLDLTQTAIEATTNEVYGEDGYKGMKIKDAIKKLCAKYGTSVRFLKPITLEEWEFGDPAASNSDPKGKFPHNTKTLLQIIYSWVEPYKTKDGLGITIAFNSKNSTPGKQNEVILWESFAPKCGIIRNCNNSLGTYLVNGGKHSAALKFSPSLKWTFALLSKSGGGTSFTSGATPAEKGDPECKTGPSDPKQGTVTKPVTSDNTIAIKGPKNALPETMAAQVQHIKANGNFESIQAELVIQGDPTLADPVFTVGRTVSIIVVSPFYMSSSGTCGDWLQSDPCNPILTNKGWMVRGSGHDISDGKYTTTIKVFLPAPGSEIALGEPLGGASGGYTLNS